MKGKTFQLEGKKSIKNVSVSNLHSSSCSWVFGRLFSSCAKCYDENDEQEKIEAIQHAIFRMDFILLNDTISVFKNDSADAPPAAVPATASKIRLNDKNVVKKKKQYNMNEATQPALYLINSNNIVCAKGFCF